MLCLRRGPGAGNAVGNQPDRNTGHQAICKRPDAAQLHTSRYLRPLALARHPVCQSKVLKEPACNLDGGICRGYLTALEIGLITQLGPVKVFQTIALDEASQ